MRTNKRAVLGCLSVIGLTLVGVGVLVALNWDAVSRNFTESLAAQTARTKATLFRLGELMSIGAALKAEYGSEPDVTYDTSTGARILSIAFDDYQVPTNVTAQGHAREIAAFAVGETKKFEEIDVVRVLFKTSTSDVESYNFARDELMPTRAEPAESALGPPRSWRVSRGRPSRAAFAELGGDLVVGHGLGHIPG